MEQDEPVVHLWVEFAADVQELCAQYSDNPMMPKLPLWRTGISQRASDKPG